MYEEQIREKYTQLGQDADEILVGLDGKLDIQKLVENQEPLGQEFEKVLHDNLWDLY